MRSIVVLGLISAVGFSGVDAHAIPSSPFDAGAAPFPGDGGYPLPDPSNYPPYEYPPGFDGGPVFFPMDAGVATGGEPEVWFDASVPSIVDAGVVESPDTSDVVVSSPAGSAGPSSDVVVSSPAGSAGPSSDVVVDTSAEVVVTDETIIPDVADAGATGSEPTAVPVGTVAEGTSAPPAGETTVDVDSPTTDGNEPTEEPNDTAEPNATEATDSAGGSRDAGADAGAIAGGSSDDGCDCRVAGSSQPGASKMSGLAFAGLAFAAMRRRRQRRS